MSDTQTRALTPRQEFEAQLNEQADNFRALLPSHVPLEKFKRVVVVAIAQNPDLFRADRRSLFMAAQKCAADGLLPDGRQAALVIFGNQVQYLPMVAGIRQRMRNSGEVLSAEAHVVYRNDKFFQKFGDDPAIVHEPPSFGVERGEPVGAYAIIRLKNGEVLREVMDRHQIDRVRSFSKSANSPAWKNWWDEMARKTVLRRCSKAAPTSADIDELLGRDDEPASTPMVDITPPEPEPPRFNSLTHDDTGGNLDAQGPDTIPPAYQVTDCDGELHEFDDAQSAADSLTRVMAEAAHRGAGHLAAARENNADLLAEFGDTISPVQGAEPMIGKGEGQVDAVGRTASANLATGARHSPAGDHGNIATPQNQERNAVGAATTEGAAPAGEMSDLLGGKPRKAPGYRVKLIDETTDGWAGWHAALVATLDAGAPAAEVRRQNHDNLAIFAQVDAMAHNKIMQRLEGGR